MTNPLTHMAAAQPTPAGKVSALCFNKITAISAQAQWTTDPKLVNCERCRKYLKGLNMVKQAKPQRTFIVRQTRRRFGDMEVDFKEVSPAPITPIAIPACMTIKRGRTYENRSKYPWSEMPVGTMFFVEGRNFKQNGIPCKNANMLSKHYNLGYHFIVLPLGHGVFENGQYRQSEYDQSGTPEEGAIVGKWVMKVSGDYPYTIKIAARKPKGRRRNGEAEWSNGVKVGADGKERG